MPQQQYFRLESVFGPAAGRMSARMDRLSYDRPDAPRDFRVSDKNFFSWLPPVDSRMVTHYRLRINHDDGEPDEEFTRGCRGVQLFYGQTFALTSFNQHSELESSPVYLEYDAEAAVFGGGSGAASYVEEHEVTSTSYSFTTAHSAAAGNILTLKIEMNSSASSITFSWSSDFEPAPLDAELDTTQGTYTLVTFVGVNSKWACISVRTGLS